MRHTLWRAALAALAVAASLTVSAADAIAPSASGAVGMNALATDYRYCTVCHGARLDGNDAIQAPALAGIEPWYLLARLDAYRQRQLGNDFLADPAGTEMRTVARELDTGRIAAIGQYVATFPVVATPASLTGDAGRGQLLYRQHCAACHGARGEGVASVRAPALARLNDWYVQAAWNKYRTGLRGGEGSDPSAQAMRALAGSLGDGFAIADVARYVHSLQRSPSP